MKQRPSFRQVLLLFGGLLLLWELVALPLQLAILPPPTAVIAKMAEIFVPKLWIHLYYSLGRILFGMSIAIILGAAIGYLMGLYPRCGQLLSPLLYFTYPIPKVALLPVVMLLCGLGLLSKTVMIVLIVIFQIILTVRDAVQEIPAETFHIMQSLSANRRQIFREVVFPATLSALLTAARLALGTAISILFFTETYGTSYGIGYFIMDAWLRMNYPEMYAGIFLLSLTGFVLFVLLDWLESRSCRWQK